MAEALPPVPQACVFSPGPTVWTPEHARTGVAAVRAVSAQLGDPGTTAQPAALLRLKPVRGAPGSAAELGRVHVVGPLEGLWSRRAGGLQPRGRDGDAMRARRARAAHAQRPDQRRQAPADRFVDRDHDTQQHTVAVAVAASPTDQARDLRPAAHPVRPGSTASVCEAR